MEYMIIVGTGILDPRSKLYCQPAVKELKDGAKEN